MRPRPSGVRSPRLCTTRNHPRCGKMASHGIARPLIRCAQSRGIQQHAKMVRPPRISLIALVKLQNYPPDVFGIAVDVDVQNEPEKAHHPAQPDARVGTRTGRRPGRTQRCPSSRCLPPPWNPPVNRVFTDSWAWYALTYSAGAGHELTQLANDKLLDSNCTLVTNNLMLAETITLLRYPSTAVMPFSSGRRCST